MRFASTISLLSTAVALTSATKLQNAMTQLCLDAFNGLSNGAGLYMGPCDQVKHGNWQILQSNEQVWIHSNEDTSANGGQGWCVDMNPSRNESPTVWQCNGGANQRFIRDPNAPGGKWSFMTTFEHPQWGAYLLSSTKTAWGSSAEIGTVSSTSAGPTGHNYEWNYIN
ncbi:hypothetical protein BG005_007687 [Podila minutissima]|nr:hypothetical protein BG005_007687 [Podila minutissima]